MSDNYTYPRALLYWTRAAEQGMECTVLLGFQVLQTPHQQRDSVRVQYYCKRVRDLWDCAQAKLLSKRVYFKVFIFRQCGSSGEGGRLLFLRSRNECEL